MEQDLDRLILIVTGAHLRAEAADRPLAYRLRRHILERLGAVPRSETEHEPEPRPAAEAPSVLVVSDLWYLNDHALRSRPTISIGGPPVNALTAFLADKLPSAFAIDDVLVVQADLDFVDPVVCCWGRDAAATAAAVDAFVERYLDGFLDAARKRF